MSQFTKILPLLLVAGLITSCSTKDPLSKNKISEYCLNSPQDKLTARNFLKESGHSFSINDFYTTWSNSEGSEEIIKTYFQAGIVEQTTNWEFNNQKLASSTILHVAAVENDTKLVKKSLACSDPDPSAAGGITPLYLASGLGHVGVVEQLLESGANTNQTVKEGWTPLHFAAKRGHAGVVKVLAKNGADLNVQNQSGHTPLLVATNFGNQKTVDELIQSGAKVDISNNSGKTPLHYAVIKNNSKILKSLLEAGAKLNLADDQGWTPLHFAAENNNESMVKKLIEAGADPMKTNEKGLRPLNLAKEEKVKRLFEKNMIDK